MKLKHYIHDIDDEMLSNIRSMLLSEDEGDNNVALEILNNSNVSNERTINQIIKLVLDTDIGLKFEIVNNNFLTYHLNR